MKQMIRLGAVLLLGSLLFLPGATAQPQMNPPDFFLSAKVSGTDEVALKWFSPPGASVDYYLVFRVSLPGTMMPPIELSSFTQIDSTTDTMMVDKPPLNEAQAFAYLVLAKTSGGPVLRSNPATVNFLGYSGDHDYVKITSIPPTRAEIGTEYQYQVVAESSDPSAVLSYFLHRGPEGMVMSPSGLVTWTPANSQVGWHRVEIRVESSLGGHREQEYFILVGGGNGVVQGYVKDTSGAPIGRVMVKLYQRHRDLHFEYSAISDANGFYRISPVNPGTYFVRAIPLRPDFMGQWYNGVRHVWEATPVSVPDSSVGITTVNFKLRSSINMRPHYTVTGKVTDDQGVALASAWVLFARPEFCFNASNHDDNGFEDGGYDRDAFDWKNFNYQWRFDHRLNGLSKWVLRVQTDAEGNYSIRLPLGKYVGLALKEGYTPIFFDGKTDLLTADIIRLTSDTTNINFALPPLPDVPLGEISGKVSDVISGDPVPSRMVAFRDVWSSTLAVTYPKTFFTDTDDLGVYTFQNLPPGRYYVLALPLGEYAPSFYSTNGPTFHWKDATPIEINGNSAGGIDIAVKPMQCWAFGYTWINGHVYANQLVGGAKAGKTQSVALPGAFVYALDAQGTVTGYALTASDGSYEISQIAPGAYTVAVERPGYEPASGSASPTYDGMLNPAPGSATLNITVTALDAPGTVPGGFALEQNYPNPFNPTTTITFSVAKPGQVTVAIYNIIGQEIIRLVDNVVPAGTYQVTWDGRDAHGRAMTSGVYLYRISADQFTATRKMLMVK